MSDRSEKERRRERWERHKASACTCGHRKGVHILFREACQAPSCGCAWYERAWTRPKREREEESEEGEEL